MTKEGKSAAHIAWPLHFPLGKAVEALGESVDALTLREPTAADLLKFGIFDGDISGEQMLDLIAQLASKPAALVRALPGADMLRLTARLAAVFRQATS